MKKRRKHPKSIMQTRKECYICEIERDLECHHCIHGTANRILSEEYGLKVWLCKAHHIEVHDVSHKLDTYLKQKAQEAFEKKCGSRQEFMKIFGKNYIE